MIHQSLIAVAFLAMLALPCVVAMSKIPADDDPGDY